MKIVVAISGASGARLGLRVLESIDASHTKHLIVSENAHIVLEKEQHIHLHDNGDIHASVASGSYGADIMLITPCSMNTLAKIACGIADNLITRAASVMIKERKTLLLAPRELPYSAIALENMHKLATLGVIVAPPVMAYYAQSDTVEAMENFIVGKWLDLVGIENNLYKRWNDEH